MSDRTAEQILQRRRVQNREAQRRFREKKSLQKTINPLPTLGDHTPSPRGRRLQQQATPPAEHAALVSALPFPDAFVTDMTQDGSWDSAPADALLATDAGFFGFNTNAAEDSTSRVASSLPNQDLEKYIYGPVEGSPAKSTLGNHSASQADCRPTPHMTGDNTQSRPLSLPPISIQENHLQSPGSTSDSSIKTLGSNWLSPLHMAAKKGSDRIISMLLRHKSDCNEPDSDGLTPLVHAVIWGHVEVTKLLLKHGAHIGNDVEGDEERPCLSAIHWAVLKRREAVLRVLLEHCPGDKVIDSYDEMGGAPLHIAIDIEFEAGVSLLLESGADSQKTRWSAPE